MTTVDLNCITFKAAPYHPHLQWATGMELHLPAALMRATGLDRGLAADGQLTIPTAFTPPSPEAANDLRLRAAFTNTPPTSSRLPISYQFVPPQMRSWFATAYGKRQRARVRQWASFPGFPLDLSADFVQDLAQPTAPSANSTLVWLTHDLDSPEGLTNVVHFFLPLEEEYGARSTNFIVPCGWEINETLLKSLTERGHEIGIHGYDHSNRTPFESDALRQERLDAAQPLISRYNIQGYRAPSLLRTPALLSDLASRYAYDSSIPTSGGLFPVPNNGCASARPFQVQGILEIPLSLPRDGSLLFLGYSPEQIAALWIECIDRIAASRGQVVLLTHCEKRFSGNQEMLKTYRKVLTHIARSPNLHFATSKELTMPMQSLHLSDSPVV